MQIVKFDSPAALDNACAGFMADILQRQPQALFCPATGSSPTGAYQQLVARKNDFDAAGIKIIKLDEWADLNMQHRGTCETYLQQHLLQPLGIATDNYIAFNSEATDAQNECARIQHYLNEHGPIDLCILGLGLNGHIAFNDPAEALQPGVHLSTLSEASLAHPMVQDAEASLSHGYTLGMADILQSKTLLLIVNGRHKHLIFQQLLKQEVSTQLPASFLWLHANAWCYYCED